MPIVTVAVSVYYMATSYRDYEREARQLVRQLLQTSLERIHHEQSQSQVAYSDDFRRVHSLEACFMCVCPRVNH